MNKTVLDEVKRAYNDSTANFNFRASSPVNIDDAVNIMCRALVCKAAERGYNGFRPELLSRLPVDAKIWLAREASVCVYFMTEKPLSSGFQDLMRADEFDEKDGMFRLWWD